METIRFRWLSYEQLEEVICPSFVRAASAFDH